MLNAFSATNARSQSLLFPLEDALNGFIVDEIEGLDPVQAILVSSDLAHQDGEQLQSVKQGKRNIVITLRYDPDYSSQSVQSLRAQLYSTFPLKREVTLAFKFDDRSDLLIKGTVESIKSPLFVREPTATISILCFDPDFYDPIEKSKYASSTSGTTNQTINYLGDQDTGFRFEFRINRTLTQFEMINEPEGQTPQKFTFAGSLASGDVLTISSVSGNKYVTLRRGNVESSYLFGAGPFSDWLSLFPGNNFFRVVASGAAIPYTIYYTDKFGGL